MSYDVGSRPQDESTLTGNTPSLSSEKQKQIQREKLDEPAGSAIPSGESSENKSTSRIFEQRGKKPVEISCLNVREIAFSAYGYMVSGGEDGKIRLWQVRDGKEVGTPIDAEGEVESTGISQDGRWIVATLKDSGVTTVWDSASHDSTIGISEGVSAVDISRTAVAIGTYKKTEVLSVSTGRRLLGPLKHYHSVAGVKLSPNGCLIATATHYPDSVRVYDCQDGRLLVNFPIGVSLGANNSRLAWVSGSKHLFAFSYDGSIHCLDVSSRTELSKWRIHSNHKSRPECISLASNGTFIAASHDSSVSFWDTSTHKEVGPVVRHPTRVMAMAISENYDLATVAGSKIFLHNLLDILPSPYRDDIFEIQSTRFEVCLQEAIETLRAQHGRLNENIANLEQTAQELYTLLPDPQHRLDDIVQQLHTELADFQWKVDGLPKLLSAHRQEHHKKMLNLEKNPQEFRAEIADFQHKATGIVQQLRTELANFQQNADSLANLPCTLRRKHQCESLYADGHILDAAQLFLEIMRTGGNDVKADPLVIDWVYGFTNKYISELERIGDQVTLVENDKVSAAYLTAPSLGAQLNKWASTMLPCGSINEAFSIASKFKAPMFLMCCAICYILEQDGRIPEAISCFQQMQSELTMDTSIHDEQAQWELGFQQRCKQKLEYLADVAIRSQNYNEAVEHLTTTFKLSLDLADRIDILIKRSNAQLIMHSWRDVLKDSDEVIKLDLSSHRDHEQRRAALHGIRQRAEAIKVFDMEESKLRERRCQYIDAKTNIRRIIDATLASMPRVLIDTTTGRLHDRTMLAAEFEALPLFTELVSSMTREDDYARVRREVNKFCQYVMFSHKWEHDEPLLQDIKGMSVYDLTSSRANTKLKTFCSTVRSLGFRWAWSDTCCIDKDNNVLLQESLVAMFSWYCGSSLTLVHLLGVSSQSKKYAGLKESIWNTRAWTYQEYVAADRVRFYTEDWKPYLGLMLSNHKASHIIFSEMGMEMAVLHPGLNNVREKLFLASTRQTTLVEDMAYSLLGIFEVAIPVIYGEGNRAVGRLLEHVLTGSGDVTILAWTGPANKYNSCLPMDLTVYNELVPPHIPLPMETADVDQIVDELPSSLTDPSHVMKLYDELNKLPPPSLASSRLRLPGIVFPVDKVILASEPDLTMDHCVYHVTTTLFGDVKIETTNDLSTMNDLYLVHPWIYPLLDQEFQRAPTRRDKSRRARRLVARLMQPFGALLFEQLSRVVYRRVATDSFIKVQICKDVLLDELIDNVSIIEVR